MWGNDTLEWLLHLTCTEWFPWLLGELLLKIYTKLVNRLICLDYDHYQIGVPKYHKMDYYEGGRGMPTLDVSVCIVIVSGSGICYMTTYSSRLPQAYLLCVTSAGDKANTSTIMERY